MPQFWRDGHYRTNARGTNYPVDGHWVNRDNWPERSYVQGKPYLPPIANRTVTFVNPNAKCPVCSNKVFYYQNEYGSRVFFDELGPPWPKHPCTDNEQFRGGGIKDTETLFPFKRPNPHSFGQKNRPHQFSQEKINRNAMFLNRYGEHPWLPLTVRKIASENDLVLVTADHLDPRSQVRKLIQIALDSEAPTIGSLIFLKDDTISFFSYLDSRPIQYAVTYTTQKILAKVLSKRAKRKKRRKMSRKIVR